ncbi:CIC11C00000002705 [Sungouiella intermedia]|uniref:Inositol-1-monophosphatase n=1 Tax=Sungouiella intermedia TaxID=45354 RepID=A0A1L0BVV8_9ASCO|nr:CIC11C00000002705 [[Candida] intermedia]
MAINLKEIEDFAVELAEAAGNILIVESRKRHDSKDIKLKMNAVDIVTETDEKVEKFIHDSIAARYPDHDFVGEESYSAGQSKKYLVTDKPTWVVDPLDGTVNYVHLFPMICVSVGFCLGGKPVAGAIHAPFLNQTYSAHLGGGAWLNKSVQLPLQLQPLPAEAPKGCIFACEWGKDRRNIPQLNLTRKVASFVNMAAQTGEDSLPGMCHGVRSMGSASLDLCFVASGAFDIWWEGGCWEWDVCAGFIIVEEAGGIITTANPPEDRSVIPEAKLGGRLYLAVRGAPDVEGETARQAQERVVRAVWDRVHLLDYERP